MLWESAEKELQPAHRLGHKVLSPQVVFVFNRKDNQHTCQALRGLNNTWDQRDKSASLALRDQTRLKVGEFKQKKKDWINASKCKNTEESASEHLYIFK